MLSKNEIIKMGDGICTCCRNCDSVVVHAAGESEVKDFAEVTYGFEAYDEQLVATSTLFRYDSGLTFEYPDAVRGVYVTGHSAGGARFETLLI